MPGMTSALPHSLSTQAAVFPFLSTEVKERGMERDETGHLSRDDGG